MSYQRGRKHGRSDGSTARDAPTSYQTGRKHGRSDGSTVRDAPMTGGTTTGGTMYGGILPNVIGNRGATQPTTSQDLLGQGIEMPMMPGQDPVVQPGMPGVDVPPLTDWSDPGMATSRTYDGLQVPTDEYEATDPEDIRERLNEAQIGEMVQRQADMRFDPERRVLEREFPAQQRAVTEAEGAMAGTGVGMGRAGVPLARQQMQELQDMEADRGMFEAAAYDDMYMRERERADALLQEEFQQYIQEQNLGIQRAQADFNQWLQERQADMQYRQQDFDRWAQEQSLGMQHAQTRYQTQGTPDQIISPGQPAQPMPPGDYLDHMAHMQMAEDPALFQQYMQEQYLGGAPDPVEPMTPEEAVRQQAWQDAAQDPELYERARQQELFGGQDAGFGMPGFQQPEEQDTQRERTWWNPFTW